MRRAAALVFVLAACGPVAEPPPGELIGVFAITATRDPTIAGSCAFSGVPDELAFEAVLSWDPATRTADGLSAWMQSDGITRPGSLEGTLVKVRAPTPRPDDPAPSVPRTLRSCGGCELRFVEWIEAALWATVPGSCAAIPEELPCAGDRCPVAPIDEAGALAPDAVGAVCGTLREEVTAAAADCTCATPDGDVALQSCSIVYRLEGRRR